ncbi:MAG: molybdenum cofactor biosynthesis protein MoaE [Proteobacteria bacterium]|nr:molybdenum cofactor biosynthesis protein MoaE [Pseudomonadota bacterium]MBU1388030.1 molybdenum cofactor biosynthesis protein MoaE [Pseudomonadota bacterium]MBU1542093.1 molybdenum cofactor biosynthesis protein MoaE [Pseudomonadota bacterium]MBU2429284.1 molybdenum cofactor biosynthesis protein MoaE [Pseudomonadota bacterium]MBU2482877.1 molybdenum cofactor biosynthesis protein MoaE [Pseudomonadota bacterium]
MEMIQLLDQMKQHPEYHKAGMILCHNGVVRETSRDGRQVNGLRVDVDHAILEKIIREQKKVPGIVDILVWINEGRNLMVGDDVMFIVVAGDIRETVIKTLTDTLNQIKSFATKKEQFFKEA